MFQAYLRMMVEYVESIHRELEADLSDDLLAQLNQIYNELHETLELIEVELGELLTEARWANV